MSTDDMKKTTDRWRREVEKRRQLSNETPEQAQERAQKEIDQMVSRSRKPPKTDEDLKREYERDIEKLRKRSAEHRQRSKEIEELTKGLQNRQTKN